MVVQRSSAVAFRTVSAEYLHSAQSSCAVLRCALLLRHTLKDADSDGMGAGAERGGSVRAEPLRSGRHVHAAAQRLYVPRVYGLSTGRSFTRCRAHGRGRTRLLGEAATVRRCQPTRYHRRLPAVQHRRQPSRLARTLTRPPLRPLLF